MSRLGLRGRLTLLYGGLFLIAGACSLLAIYVVVERRIDAELYGDDAASRIEALREAASASPDATVTLPNGDVVRLETLLDETRQEREAIKDAALNGILIQGSVAVLVIGLLAGSAGWVVAGRGLRPLHKVTMTARRIAGSRGIERDLTERIALVDTNDEIRDLAASFNAMLDTLDRAFDAQRRFVANASHELRTPLALERAVAELEATRPGITAESRHAWESMLAINARHTQLIDGLLTLIESGNAIADPEDVPLDDLVAGVLAATAPEAAQRGIHVRREPGSAVVRGDAVLLELLVRNLVENALRHNVPAGWVRIAIRPGEQDVVLEISNSGPVIPAGEIGRLIEPFQRLQRETPGGFGLGLSIVRAIAEAHAATLTLDPLAEGGLRAVVTFRSGTAAM